MKHRAPTLAFPSPLATLVAGGVGFFTLLLVGCGSDTPDSKAASAHETDAGVEDAGAGGNAGSTRDAATGGGKNDAARGGADSDSGRAADSGDTESAPDGAIMLPPFVCDGTATHFAKTTFSHAFGPGQNVGQNHFPAWVYGPPEGLGQDCQGATDGVVSLGNGGTVTLGFGGDAIVDGPGPDFIVFENAFGIDCDATNVFAELGTVEVSDDGVTWHEYPCTATAAPYGACAGTHPVYANEKTNTIDPRDPATAGGDAYDLADVGLSRARLIRITDRPDTSGISGVFDLDAVAIVNSACP